MSVATPFRRTARRCRAASSISPTMHRNETSVDASNRVVRASIALLSVTYHTNSMCVATPLRRTARRCRAASPISATIHRNETSVEKYASTPSYRVVRASIAPVVRYITHQQHVHRNPAPAHGSALSCSVFHLSDNAPQRNKYRKTRVDSFLQGRSGFDCPVVCYIPYQQHVCRNPAPAHGSALSCSVFHLSDNTPQRNKCRKHASIPSYRVVRALIALLSVTYHTNSMSVATPFRRTARRCRAASSISPTMHCNETSVEKHASTPSYRVVRASITLSSVTLHQQHVRRNPVPAHGSALSCSVFHLSDNAPQRNKYRKTRIDSFLQGRSSLDHPVVCYITHQQHVRRNPVPAHGSALSCSVFHLSDNAPQRNKCRKIRIDSFLQGRSGFDCPVRYITHQQHVRRNPVSAHGSALSCSVFHLSDNAPKRNKCRKIRIDSFLQGRSSLDHPVVCYIPHQQHVRRNPVPAHGSALSCSVFHLSDNAPQRNKYGKTRIDSFLQGRSGFDCPVVRYITHQQHVRRNPVPAHGSALSCSVFHLSDNAPQRNKYRKTRVDSFLQGRSGLDRPVVCYIPYQQHVRRNPAPAHGSALSCSVFHLSDNAPQRNKCRKTRVDSFLQSRPDPSLLRRLLHTNSMSAATPS